MRLRTAAIFIVLTILAVAVSVYRLCDYPELLCHRPLAEESINSLGTNHQTVDLQTNVGRQEGDQCLPLQGEVYCELVSGNEVFGLEGTVLSFQPSTLPEGTVATATVNCVYRGAEIEIHAMGTNQPVH